MIREEIIPLIAKYLQPAVYVELGLGYAGPTNFYRVLEALPNSKCHGVDIVDMIERFKNMPNAFIFCGTTDAFWETWIETKNPTIDMIFIDADHSENAVFNDVLHFYQLLTPDTGVMILHDSWPVGKDWTGPDKSGTVYKAIQHIKDAFDDIEVFTLPIHHGLTFIRKVGDNWRNG